MTDKTKKRGTSFVHTHSALCAMIVLTALALVLLCVSFALLQVPVVTAGTFLILESVLCACLRKAPIGVHAAAVVLQIILGVYFHQTVFVILMAVMYIAALSFISIWEKADRES